MELRYGCSKRNDRDRFWKSIEKEILSRIEVLPIGKEESIIAGDLLAYLHKKGTPIGIEDVLIASVCLSRHLTLITTNTKHFRLIPKIKVENWLY
jgi:tRNA(fMet)-specific endonuclease VapC